MLVSQDHLDFMVYMWGSVDSYFSAEFADDAEDALKGLSFELTEEQRAFQLAARQFSEDVIIPAAAELDRTMKFPHEIFDQAWELGLVNAHIPEAYGGLGRQFDMPMTSAGILGHVLATPSRLRWRGPSFEPRFFAHRTTTVAPRLSRVAFFLVLGCAWT